MLHFLIPAFYASFLVLPSLAASSGYFNRLNPTAQTRKYHSTHEEFQAASEKVVAGAIKMLAENPNISPESLFAYLASKRQKIAKRANSPFSTQFGMTRIGSRTLLSSPFLMGDVLYGGHYEPLKKNLYQITTPIQRSYLNRTIFVNTYRINPNFLDLSPISKRSLAALKNAIDKTNNDLASIVGMPMPYPDNCHLYELETEIEGVRVRLAQYVFGIYKQTMLPIIVHIHQDHHMLDLTLKELSSLFERALAWQKKPVEQLVNLVGEIRYLLAVSAPYVRGSAAIGEWLETIIYRHHGFKNFSPTSETLWDLEAIACVGDFEGYMNRYHQLTLRSLQKHTA